MNKKPQFLSFYEHLSDIMMKIIVVGTNNSHKEENDRKQYLSVKEASALPRGVYNIAYGRRAMRIPKGVLYDMKVDIQLFIDEYLQILGDDMFVSMQTREVFFDDSWIVERIDGKYVCLDNLTFHKNFKIMR